MLETRQIAHYRVLDRLGAGSMGEVWRAQDTKLNREVAIKLLPAAFAADADRLARFRREAQVLASLNHPNIAAIYGVEENALVMELVGGETLAQRIAQGAMPWDEALPIATQIADGLEYAHERGVVHRDLKPANVIITPEGRVKILDFGLAKALANDTASSLNADAATLTSPATMIGSVMGTAAYMAPEQARGKIVDRRADIWAFGVVLYEMLSGRRPFAGEDVAETMASVLKAEPELARLPEPARSVVSRCLQKDARQRWGWIGEARHALLQAPAAVVVAERRSWWRVAAAAMLALALGAALAWWVKPDANGTEAMHFSAVTSFDGVQSEPSFSPDGRSIVFVSNRDGHFNLYDGLINAGVVQITHDANLKEHPAWSPDGTTIAYGRLNDSGVWDVWEVSALGGNPRRVVLNANDPSWTPDGKGLIYSDADQSIWKSGVSGENARTLVPRLAGFVDTQARMSPDGKWLAFAARSESGGPYCELALADLTRGTTRLLTHDGALALSPAWSSDGAWIYFASSRGGTLNIWKADVGGGPPREVTAGTGDDADLDVSSDGKRIIFGTMRMQTGLEQWDLTAKPGATNPTPLTSDLARSQYAPTYSPDGKHLAYFTNLKGVEHESIVVADANGANPVTLAQDDRVNLYPLWMPDSEQLVYLSNAPGITSLRLIGLGGGASRTLISKMDGGVSMDVGRDGRVLIMGADGEAESFDTKTGKAGPLMPTGAALPPGAGELRWSPDQLSVAYLMRSSRENDSQAGVWVTDFRRPPRQIFKGWVSNFTTAGDEIYILERKPDLSTALWKAGWNVEAAVRLPASLPLVDNFNYRHTLMLNQFAVAPDGRRIAFQNPVMQENIGMITLGSAGR